MVQGILLLNLHPELLNNFTQFTPRNELLNNFTLHPEVPKQLPQECSELPNFTFSIFVLRLSVVQGILLLNLHPELLNNFT